MKEALITVKDATYIGSVVACELSLRGEALGMHEIESLKLWAGDASSSLAKTDGTSHRLYEKRRFRSPRLLLKGSISLRLSSLHELSRFDVGDLVYMTLNNVK